MILKLESKRHEHAPTAYHLQLLATDLFAQGQGVGSDVIKVGIALAEAAGVPCYLETFNPKNHAFYRRHGFVPVDAFKPLEGDPTLPDGGPVATLFLRETKKE